MTLLLPISIIWDPSAWANYEVSHQVVLSLVQEDQVDDKCKRFRENEEQYETTLDATEEILEQVKEDMDSESRYQQQQQAEVARQAAAEVERVGKKELLTVRRDGLKPGDGQYVGRSTGC